ncbi:putative transcriptional regulator [Sphaerochaeta pleomorpha str. Grapes]|uniref:Putative transcriptional regulator n=1 Tax=Sphaerochaeta pleomorpha (strain ATCC BAA-1885 / DSM 22778 / Grapes) TaxID=158190 RepID=G8QY73_SPHPG|nr:WYL domain-containing protein [Sphaerochaeta pleomorpha]AEV29638.1 putative transcriptional regulator [Sphaerochaeta pleomorpha str. Grapes]
MKGERVAQLEPLLHSHPEGLRRAEIARRLGVHRSTISRYVDELKQYIDIYEENNLIKIKDKEGDENIALSVYESLAFNLSAEILATNSEFQNPHLASGLRKIAMNMRSYAPKISDNVINLAEQIDKQVQQKKESSKFNSILEVLIDSWVSGRIVRIIQMPNGFEPVETELAPYFIGFREEDSGGRNPISVTGRLRHTTEIITIDISTITSATILDETYTIPDNLKPFKLRENTEQYASIDMIPLRLKLKERSAMNVFHTVVHGTPEFDKLEDGTLICSMDVENSIELFLRIIQCGDSVEILSPESFKKKFCKMLNKILVIYQ